MKKAFILLFILLLTGSVSNGQFKLGGGLGVTTGFPFHDMPWDANRSGHLDVFAKAIIKLSLPVQLSPSITVFIPHVTKVTQFGETTTTTVSTLMFDINGHYVFNTLDKFQFYGLAGFDIMLAGKKEVIKMTGSSSTGKERDNALGLNVGAGADMKLTEQIDLFAEAKYVICGKNKLFLSNYNQLMVNAGVLINLGWLSKNENKEK
jgi:hypothetical protein